MGIESGKVRDEVVGPKKRNTDTKTMEDKGVLKKRKKKRTLERKILL